MTDFPEFTGEERQQNEASRHAQRGRGKARRAFLTQGKKLASEQILEALEASGKDATWYAEKVASLIATGTTRTRLRALELIAKIVAQKEGKKVLTGELASLSEEELQAAYEEVMAEKQEKREAPKSN